jgi:uncharacterized protein with ParB-like and HNH nuclease domain
MKNTVADNSPKYEVREFSFNDLSTHGVTVPRFQRALVWSESAKRKFIETPSLKLKCNT